MFACCLWMVVLVQNIWKHNSVFCNNIIGYFFIKCVVFLNLLNRRDDDEEGRHKSRHKKEKKLKQEPVDDEDDANGSPNHSDESAETWWTWCHSWLSDCWNPFPSGFDWNGIELEWMPWNFRAVLRGFSTSDDEFHFGAVKSSCVTQKENFLFPEDTDVT